LRQTHRGRRIPRPPRTERHRSLPGRSSFNSRRVEKTDRRANLHQFVRHFHHVSNPVLDRHAQLTSDLAHINPATVLEARQLIHVISIRRRHSPTIQLGDEAPVTRGQPKWFDPEHVVPPACSPPHLIVLQQVRVIEHTPIGTVTKKRHATVGL